MMAYKCCSEAEILRRYLKFRKPFSRYTSEEDKDSREVIGDSYTDQSMNKQSTNEPSGQKDSSTQLDGPSQRERPSQALDFGGFLGIGDTQKTPKAKGEKGNAKKEKEKFKRSPRPPKRAATEGIIDLIRNSLLDHDSDSE